jgi:mannose-6-phosphate isomerase-like protein (cupin superfamily)
MDSKEFKHLYDWREHAGSRPEKFFKTTLWEGGHVMIGLNCLEPGQVQPEHAHSGSDKFYFVLEGSGIFVVGDKQFDAGTGMLVTAPAGVTHGVKNDGETRLSLLVSISPGINR